jgi:3-methyladenine DNA glycosylase AlkD
MVARAGTIPAVVPYLFSSHPNCDPKLKQQVFYALAQIAKHSVAFAEEVVAGNIFPIALFCLKDRDETVRRLAAGLVREIVKHTQELAQLVMVHGAAAALVHYLKPESQNEPINAVMAIGHIASCSQSLALALLAENAGAVTLNVFVSAKSYQSRTAKTYESLMIKTYYVMTAAAWAIGQLGKHSPEHAQKLTKLNALSLLLDAHNDPQAPEDLQVKTRRAFKNIVLKCTDHEVIRPLITPAPDRIKKYILEQIAKLLPKNPKWLRPFFASGGLRDVQRVSAAEGSKTEKYIKEIKKLYPAAAVEYYDPEYARTIITEIENYDLPAELNAPLEADAQNQG